MTKRYKSRIAEQIGTTASKHILSAFLMFSVLNQRFK